MANALEQLKSLGFDNLPEGLTAEKIVEVLSNADEFKGAFSAVARLKDENSTLKDKVTTFEQEKAALEAEKEAALRANLEAEGKFDELRQLDKEAHERELEKQKGETGKYIEQLKNSAKETATSKLASLFDKQYSDIADVLVKDLVQTDVVGGSVVTKFVVDGKELSSFEEAKEFMTTVPKYASRMAGAQTKGAPAGGGDDKPTFKKPHEMNSQERIAFKNRDPEGFKKAFNL